jgi:hypothetical protein
VNLLRGLLLENRPGHEKPDARQQTLEHPTQIGERHAGLEGDQHEEGGPQGDEHVGPQPGRLAAALPLVAQDAPEEDREQHAEHELCHRPDPR